MSEAPKINHVHYDENSLILDREQLDMLIMGDEDEIDQALAAELFDLFANESAAKLELLPEVCAQGDVLQLRNIVHFIAGSAGNMGLARLASFYRGIEQAIDEKQLTDISQIEATIRLEFETARDVFRDAFNL
ncbi:Hpt domain-containing protein [Coraliomargarita algicola]|uniref:Hpt domain-containing protein n=1 Tax=Coraliomargarita algicola TaxID=3092156 RepID=A0ABZ0RRD7_9BACT|nr:Hpt domain-containing protein [Coraliomargarita sp. J2-16]WPJ97355.1 Hpt domain-containing protein [Coraliomargarita sp. J2-16]